MNDLKILYAFGFKDEHAMIVGYLKTKMVTELSAAGLSVSRIEAVRTKQEVEDMMNEGDFNLLIVKEQLDEDKISSGAIKSWTQRYPNLKVILCVGNDKRGGEKLNRLLRTAPFYYNALYENDLTGSNVAKLLACSRSKDEAVHYYGLEDRVEAEGDNQTPKIVEAGKEEKETRSTDKHAEAPVISDSEVSPQELEAVISGFDAVETEETGKEDIKEDMSEEKKGGDANRDVEEETSKFMFDYSEMFSGNALFGTSYQEKGMRTQEEIMAAAEEVVVVDTKEDDSLKAVQEETRKSNTMDDVLLHKPVDVLPEIGKVLKVLDSNTMLMELSTESGFLSEKSMEDYKMFFVIRGTRGTFVDGKYKVGVKSFEGYAGRLIDKRMVLVETPGYDLIENRLENEECSIICIAQ